jgi:hypothetical protein
MALQWYRLDPMTGRLVWQESETRPGPGWEASDVPLGDSDLAPAPELGSGETVQGQAWTIQEDSPVYLQEEDFPVFRLDRAVRKDLPPGELPAYEYRKAHPTEYQSRPALRLVDWDEEDSPAAQAAVREGLAWLTRNHPSVTARAPEQRQGSLVPRPEDSGHSPRVRAWWRTVHRLSSVRRGLPVLPWRSGPRVAGYRKGEGRR